MRPLTMSRFLSNVALWLLLLLLIVWLSPGIGSQSSEIGPRQAWRAWLEHKGTSDAQPDVAYEIAFGLRLPRTILAIEVGITLALCGAVFQTLFRNPLATPYTLGISSGGSLGALIAIHLGWEIAYAGISLTTLCSFAGALGVVLIVFLFARGARRLTTHELLLAGVTMGLFCSAMMMLVTYFSNARQTFEIVRWMMGSLDSVGHGTNTASLPLLAPCWLILICSARSLNQYILGDELASARGVHVARLQVTCIVVASLATGVVVAICGPIGFVGLVVPQIIRRMVGGDCRLVLPVSALAGGCFLAVCDWLSQLAMTWVGVATHRNLSGIILPIGVITAVLGVPIFLILLRKRPEAG